MTARYCACVTLDAKHTLLDTDTGIAFCKDIQVRCHFASHGSPCSHRNRSHLSTKGTETLSVGKQSSSPCIGNAWRTVSGASHQVTKVPWKGLWETMVQGEYAGPCLDPAWQGAHGMSVEPCHISVEHYVKIPEIAKARPPTKRRHAQKT